jgi:tRNA 2-thiouridine synthesizing protein D
MYFNRLKISQKHGLAYKLRPLFKKKNKERVICATTEWSDSRGEGYSMTSRRTLVVTIMDFPYESADPTTALHIIREALMEGHNVKVFAYEGAINFTRKTQQFSDSRVKEASVEEKRQTAANDQMASLFQMAKQRGVKLDWLNCRLCVDNREARDSPEGLRNVGPRDLVNASLESDATMVVLIPTK